MWFKNIQIFLMTEDFTLSPEQFHEKLFTHVARPCGSLERSTLGWAPPLGHGHDRLVHQVGSVYCFACRKEDKVLPPSVIREEVASRLLEVEQQEGYKVGNRQRRQITDEVTLSFLPKALAKSSITYAYLDTRNKWLIIDTASRPKAEEVLTLLRHSLGRLTVKEAQVNQSIAAITTQWLLKQQAPAGFTLEQTCQMQDPQAERTVIRCINQDLTSQEVLNHLENGKQITQIELSWQDRVNFILCQPFAVKRIRFLDLVQEQSDLAEVDEDPETQFTSELAITAGEFAALLPALFDCFGGLVGEEQIAAHEKALAMA